LSTCKNGSLNRPLRRINNPIFQYGDNFHAAPGTMLPGITGLRFFVSSYIKYRDLPLPYGFVSSRFLMDENRFPMRWPAPMLYLDRRLKRIQMIWLLWHRVKSYLLSNKDAAAGLCVYKGKSKVNVMVNATFHAICNC
jgi:hypothetical protein